MARISPIRLVGAFLRSIGAQEQDDTQALNAYTAGVAARRAEQPRHVPSTYARCTWAFLEGWDALDHAA